MVRHAIDRWTDTTPFRVVLLLSAFGVLPVLLMGVSTTLIGGAGMLIDGSYEKPGPSELALTLLSVGGALGFVGYLRAHAGYIHPRRHNVTTTLLFLTAGVLAALAVAGSVAVMVVEAWGDPFDVDPLLVAGALFVVANLVWVFAGIAWMQRLIRGDEEKTGRAFDGVPVVLLFVALALGIGAALTTMSL